MVLDAQDSTNLVVLEHNRIHLTTNNQIGGILLFEFFPEFFSILL